MSRKIVLVAAVLLVPAYVAASWGLGRATHARFDAYEQQWNKHPMALLKVAERKHTSGVFSSEERITFELNEKLFGKIFESEGVPSEDASLEGGEGSLEDAVQNSLAEDNRPLRVTILNKVQHGPLPGFRSFGLARIETSLALSDEVRAKVAEVLGDKDPLLVTTVLGFTGAGSSTMTSPAFDIEKDGTKLSWKGFEGAFSYGRNMSSIECDLSAPGMDLTDKDGVHMQMGEISFDCDLERAFDDLYVGTGAFTVASLHRSAPGDEKPMKIERVTYAGDIRKNGDYVDMGVKLGVANMELEEFAMTDLRYDIAINHLHGPTYAAMQRKLQDTTATSLDDPSASLAVMGAFGEFLPQLLEHSPQIVIERIGFSMPEGEAGLKATVQLNGFTKEDMTSGSTMALLGKLDASADIWFSEGLLMRDWTQRASDETGGDADAANKVAMMQMQVAQLEQQGYIQRKADRLETHIEFKNGALSANGKPIGPMTQ